ncbi:unnamed protein product [Boreogadus saida]
MNSRCREHGLGQISRPIWQHWLQRASASVARSGRKSGPIWQHCSVDAGCGALWVAELHPSPPPGLHLDVRPIARPNGKLHRLISKPSYIPVFLPPGRAEVNEGIGADRTLGAGLKTEDHPPDRRSTLRTRNCSAKGVGVGGGGSGPLLVSVYNRYGGWGVWTVFTWCRGWTGAPVHRCWYPSTTSTGGTLDRSGHLMSTFLCYIVIEMKWP